MPLRSQLFAGQRRLEACSRNHADHILLGAIGDHVERIQRALVRLDKAFISPGELKIALYGQSTAKAVLAYKTKRKIINHAYQSVEDDIVGVMTINQMDDELLKRPRTNLQPGICELCGTEPSKFAARALAPGGAGSFALKSKSVNVTKSTKKQFGGVVRMHVQEANGLALKGIAYPIGEMVERARDLLGEYGITLLVENRFRPQSIVFTGDVILDEDKLDIYRASLRHFPANDAVYRVIVCSLGKSTHFADTFRNFKVDGKIVPKFTLINANLVPNGNIVVLHEMIHASYKELKDHDPERHSVFFEHAKETGRGAPDDPLSQTLFKEEHADSIAHSYFARGAR